MDYSKELNISAIIAHVILGTADSAERKELSDWLAESEENRKVYFELIEKTQMNTSVKLKREMDSERFIKKVRYRLNMEDRKYEVKSDLWRKRWIRPAVAACIVAAVGLSAILFQHQHRNVNNENTAGMVNVLPSSKVKIVLATGEEISTEQIKEGIETPYGTISRNEQGLILTGTNNNVPADMPKRIHKVITEVGGEIHFTLNDGTEVWLNAKSQLSFLFAFEPDERKVFLNGEAYFKVAENKHAPFIVVTDKMKIRVTGTAFNVKSYVNDPCITTTLVSGHVSVITKEAERELMPGMVANLKRSTDEIYVYKEDTGLSTAWLDGYFMFNNERLDAIFSALERWYDVTFVFENTRSAEQVFTGRFRKNELIKEILDRITLAGGPEFEFKNKQIYIKE